VECRADIEGDAPAAVAPAHPLRRALAQLNWAFIDQAVSSGTNFVLALLVVRSVSADAFGEFSIVVLLYILAIGAGRALVAEPVMIAADRYRSDPRPTDRAALDLALTVGAALAVVMFAAAAVIGGSLGKALVVLGVCFPLLLVQDGARGLFLARLQPKRAAVNDITWAMLQFAALGVVLRDDSPAVWLCAAAWLGSGAAAGLVALWQLRVAPSGRLAVAHLRANRRSSGPFLLNYALTSCPQYAVFAIAPLVSSMRELGLARAAFVPFGALGIVLQSAALVLMPVAAGLALGELRAIARRASAVLSVLAVVCAVAVLCVPDQLGERLVGEEWDATRPAQVAYAALLFAQAVGIGPTVVLRVLGRTSSIVRIRLLALPVVLGLGLALPPAFGAPGTVAAVAAGEAPVPRLRRRGVLRPLGRRTPATEPLPHLTTDSTFHAIR
jgi:hypothetical protein